MITSLSIQSISRPSVGIAFVVLYITVISLNDMLIKYLSDSFALHQIVFCRSVIGLAFTLFLVQLEGGFKILKTRQPLLHLFRGILIVISNITYFMALAVASLAEVTALFFVAPLLITLLSIPLLGEKVGPSRLGAVAVGFAGVLLMLQPWKSEVSIEGGRLLLLLPILSACAYALMQILTRRLGGTTKASAMAFYIHMSFILSSLIFYWFLGDGRHAGKFDNSSLEFLLRAWVWPEGANLYILMGLGFSAAISVYALTQAYRSADAATVAPFEYIGLPLSVFWGWMMWGDIPGPVVFSGICLILTGGMIVLWRERVKRRRLALAPPLLRR